MDPAPKWPIKNLCVFCGSAYPKDERHEKGAKTLAAEMLKRHIGLVYGGGTRGMMGIVGKAVFEGAFGGFEGGHRPSFCFLHGDFIRALFSLSF